MSDPTSNPSAPLTFAEIEAPAGRDWHVDGVGVMVRAGTILPKVDLNLPNVEQLRASGSPERVFQTHLRHCEGHMIRGPGSAEELMRRIEDEKEITDRVLTERSYQDEVRQFL